MVKPITNSRIVYYSIGYLIFNGIGQDYTVSVFSIETDQTFLNVEALTKFLIEKAEEKMPRLRKSTNKIVLSISIIDDLIEKAEEAK